MTDYEATTTVHEIMIDPADFDPSRVVIHDPVTSSFKVGGADIEMTTSKGYYLDDEGNECKLYFPAPAQSCFGPTYQYDMNITDEEKGPSKAKGVQVGYPMTSLQSISAPTPEEQAFMDIIQGLWECSLEKGKEETAKTTEAMEADPDHQPAIPSVSYTSFLAASSNKRWTSALKPAFEHPNESGSSGKKTIDTTKPKRMYIKLRTAGRGEKMRVLTPFFGPGDKKESPIKYIEKRGVITPCIEWDGMYWGGHGRNSHGASLRFFIVEANYVPITAADSLPTTRMLPKNTAISRDEPEEIGDDDDDDTFAKPSKPALTSAPQPRAKAKVAPKVAPKAKAAVPKVAPKAKAAPKAKVALAPAKAAPKAKTVPLTSAPAAKPKAVVTKAVAPKAKTVKPPPPPPVEDEEVEEAGEEWEADDMEVEEGADEWEEYEAEE